MSETPTARPGGPGAPASGRPTCRHCGSPAPAGEEFCCNGCAYVHRLIGEQGLGAYYQIKDAVTPPADPAVFQTRDYAWLAELQKAAEDAAGERTPELVLGVQGISCAACVWLIEHLHGRQPGAGSIAVNAQTGRLRLRWQRGFDAPGFARVLQSFNYLVGPPSGTEEDVSSESRDLARRIGLGTAFTMNIMLFALPVYFGMEADFAYARLFGTLSMVFGTLTVLTGGIYFLARAARAVRVGAMHIDLPIAVGITGAYLGSMYGWVANDERFVYFDFVGTFIVLMLIGRWAQVAAVERNRRRLLSRQPQGARLHRLEAGGRRRPIAVEAVVTGDRFLLAGGQALPVDARLESGSASFSLASINGEAEPRVFGEGQRVPAGAVSLTGAELTFVALQAWRDSLLARLLGSGPREGFRHLLLERIVRGYLIGIFGLATTAGILWWLGTGDVARTWAVVTAVLVVSCPCAIGLSFPLADELATVALRRRGVFVREGDLFAKLRRVRAVIFDKTGTLTLEAPELRDREALSRLDGEARAALLGLVRDHPHPVAQALAAPLLATGGVPPADGGEVLETVGQGLERGGWSVGRAGWRDGGPAGEGTIFVRDGRVLARFEFDDHVRADAREVIAGLRRRGKACYILSGDRRDKVERIARELGLDPSDAIGEQSPDDKAAWLDRHAPGRALMLGDGANDSLAFDRALCRGTPVIHRGVLSAKADFYYLGRGLSGLEALLDIDRVRARTQMALLVFSVAYNLFAVGLAMAGQINPLVAAIIMPLSSLTSLAIVGLGLRPAWTLARG